MVSVSTPARKLVYLAGTLLFLCLICLPLADHYQIGRASCRERV